MTKLSKITSPRKQTCNQTNNNPLGQGRINSYKPTTFGFHASFRGVHNKRACKTFQPEGIQYAELLPCTCTEKTQLDSSKETSPNVGFKTREAILKMDEHGAVFQYERCLNKFANDQISRSDLGSQPLHQTNLQTAGAPLLYLSLLLWSFECSSQCPKREQHSSC